MSPVPPTALVQGALAMCHQRRAWYMRAGNLSAQEVGAVPFASTILRVASGLGKVFVAVKFCSLVLARVGPSFPDTLCSPVAPFFLEARAAWNGLTLREALVVSLVPLAMGVNAHTFVMEAVTRGRRAFLFAMLYRFVPVTPLRVARVLRHKVVARHWSTEGCANALPHVPLALATWTCFPVEMAQANRIWEAAFLAALVGVNRQELAFGAALWFVRAFGLVASAVWLRFRFTELLENVN
eukprot:CAMPEP_0182925426 /NCGR_PEP_ID=MMETSP0105_2-20130417/9405_1 /TAXON_ID=81532 ORGANISM="Acanthoeca-like sp., Strain 10tr" /NCGR_SAMPLE_ID=MMETSP0105_2 /ASSEMBLY_ACC=CAM_ASM_000205 /LENGTH=239 /DNA_ID=CAMNT_0025063275 /DNA_START=1010 /DNA_END=1729 /DNA_ORIENTATION=-